MSISMEKFSSEGHFATYDPFPPTQRRMNVFSLQCRACGFEPDETLTPPRLCPKCHGNAWERFAKPGSILDNANRFQ